MALTDMSEPTGLAVHVIPSGEVQISEYEERYQSPSCHVTLLK